MTRRAPAARLSAAITAKVVKCRTLGCMRKSRANHGFCYQHSEMRQVRVKPRGWR